MVRIAAADPTPPAVHPIAERGGLALGGGSSNNSETAPSDTASARDAVIAVGTTVTRALETTADHVGIVHPARGWTELVLGTRHPARVVDAIVTGWHAPGASHLDLLVAVVGEAAVYEAYVAALETGYLWHEFGDSALLFGPGVRRG